MSKSGLVAFLVLMLAVASTASAAEPPAPSGEALDPHGGSRAGGELTLAALPPSTSLLAMSEGAGTTGAAAILTGALYGALAGAVIGTGVALLENDNYGRDIALGAGVGIIVGAALGTTHAFGDRRGVYGQEASDGLGTTERYPVLTARALKLGGRF